MHTADASQASAVVKFDRMSQTVTTPTQPAAAPMGSCGIRSVRPSHAEAIESTNIRAATG